MGVPFATLAAMGSASGIPWLAGLAAIPAATLIASDTIGIYLSKHKTGEQDAILELTPPLFWTTDVRAWQDLCIEIEDHLPTILHDLGERIHKVQGVVTMETVQQLFIDSLTAEHLTWAPDGSERRQVAEFIAPPLLQKLGEMLGPIIEQIQRETALMDIHKTALGTEKTVSVLEEILDVHKPPTFNDNEIAVLRQHYCHDIYERWKILDFRGIMHVEMHRPMGIPLTEVFICPDVLVGVPEFEMLEREEELKSEEKKTQKAQDNQGNETVWRVEQYRQTKREKPVALQREALSAVLGKKRRLVVLGHPGAGKSTLLRYFMLRLAHDPEKFAQDFPYLMDVSLDIPFYMPLASYAEFRRSNPSGERSLKQFLHHYLSENYLESYSSFLRNQLEQGRVLLLFDGLDEIPDVAFRATIVQHIEALTQSYPQNHFIVTNRIVGYKQAPIAADYQPYTLADFNQQQIETFTRRWCPAYESWVRGTTDQQILHEAATMDAERLFNATQHNPGVKKLAVNPLLLTILALIQRQGIELPSHRVELFYRCTETLLDTWITAKGQTLPFSKTQLVKILRPLAFWMHQQRTVGAIPEEDLVEQIVKQLLNRKITTDEGEALKLAEAFLKTVRGQTGILVERGKERYGFLHQAFEEYFAARELEIRPDRNDFIKKYLHEARWREVILLSGGAIGILHSNEEGVTEIVQDVIMQAQSPFEEWLHRDLLFAGLCLADDIGVSVTCENKIVEEIVLLYLTSPYNSLRNAFSDVLTEWNGTPVGRKAARLILSMLRKQELLTAKATTVTTSQALENSFQEKLREYFQRILQQGLWAVARVICFHIIMFLHRLQIEQDIISNPVEYSLNHLSDTFYVVRETAASLLGQLDKSQPSVIDGLVKLLSDNIEDVRKSAASALGQLSSGNGDNPEVVKVLLIALTDPDENVRQAAALALGKVGSTQPEVIEELLNTLSDTEKDVRQASVTALGQISNLQSTVAETLIHTLDRSDWRIREGIAKIFGELSNAQPRIIEVLIHTLLDPNDDVRQAVIVSLGRLGVAQNHVLDALLIALSNRSWEVRQAAATALGQLGNSQPEVVKTLTHALSDDDVDVRLAAATALAKLRSSQPEMMESLLHAPSLDVRQAAAIALGHTGNTQPEVIGALIHMLTDSSWQVRQTATKAIEELRCSQSEVMQALLKMFSDSDSDVREAAAKALGRLGNSQPEVVKTLVHMLSDANENVRSAASLALSYNSNIQPEMMEAMLQVFYDFDEDVLKHVEAIPQSTVKYLLATLSNAANLGLPQKLVSQLQQELYNAFTQRQVKLLEEMGTEYEQVIETLLHTLADTTEHKEVRQASVTALGQLKNAQPEVIETLLHTLANSDNLMRLRIVTALDHLGVAQPCIIDSLLLLLSDFYLPVCKASASALSKLAATEPSIFDSLIHSVTDSHSYTTDPEMIPILLGWVGITKPEVVQALLQITKSFSLNTRREAIRALGQMGTSQPEVVQALLQALSDADQYTRRVVASSLANLRVDRVTCSSHIQELLQKESSLASNMFEADDVIDALLFAMYQINEKV